MHASTLRRTLVLSTLFALTLALTAHAQTPVVEAENDSGETLLQVNDDAGFVLLGSSGTGVIPAEGRGVRLMWHPAQAAFRAGYVTSSGEWDDDNVGFASAAMGYSTTASGYASTATGNGTTASGSRSVAMGFETEASGSYSTAMNRDTEASGGWSTAMNRNTKASGSFSTAMGSITTATTDRSLSIGECNDANSSSDDNVLFVVGNGNEGGIVATCDTRSDALVLDESGNLTIAGNLTESSDRRLKTDIESLDENVMEALAEIRPVRYRFREGTGHPTDAQIGLIAQEVAAHFPELVREGSDGYLSLAYTNLTTVLLKGLQEQQQENEALAARVEALSSENETLEARVATLERMMQDRSPVAAGATGYAPLLASVLLLLGGAFVLHRRRSAA